MYDTLVTSRGIHVREKKMKEKALQGGNVRITNFIVLAKKTFGNEEVDRCYSL